MGVVLTEKESRRANFKFLGTLSHGVHKEASSALLEFPSSRRFKNTPRPRIKNSAVLLSPKEFSGAMGVDSNPTAAPQPIPTEGTADRVQELLEAARYDDIEDVVSLYTMGVSLDSKDSQGRTALHMASANGHLDIVQYLIRNSVDVNAENAEKNTPLHWACLNGHIEVVKALILGGAAVSALNSHERTPMDEAVNRGKMEVVDAISTAVAQLELEGVSVSS